MDNLTKKMLNDFTIVQRMLPDVSMMQKMLDDFAITQKMLPDVSMMKTILDDLVITQKMLPDVSMMQKMLDDFVITQKMLPDVTALQLAKSLEVIALAHVSLIGLSPENIGKAINVSDAARGTLSSNFINFSNSYFDLYQSFSQLDVDVSAFGSFSFQLPVTEFFNGTDLLESITVQEVEDDYAEKKQSIRDEISMQTTDALQTLLTDLDVNLVRLWLGALQSLDSDNVDRSRHFLISLRELFTQVLHKLAPDNEVYAWTTSPALFHNGKPTRQARLLFICRDINNDPFSSFVEKDIACALASWEILNRAHEVTIPFTQKQLVAFKIRMESVLRLLLVTWQSNK